MHWSLKKKHFYGKLTVLEICLGLLTMARSVGDRHRG
jgi:hypothetical protein